MPITGSERYRRAFDAKGFEVTCRKGTSRVSGIAASTKPKLYIVSVAEIAGLCWLHDAAYSQSTTFRL